MKSEFESFSVVVLQLSTSGKAVEVIDPERPADDNSLWIPCSLIDEYSLSHIEDYISSMGTDDIEVKAWFLEKEGWL